MTAQDTPLPWGEFSVVCKMCDSENVSMDNSMGFSAQSGAWGSINLVCNDCGNETVLMEAN